MKNLITNVHYLLKLYIKYGRLPFIICLLQSLFSSTVIIYIDVNIVRFVVDGLLDEILFIKIIPLLLTFFSIQLFYNIWTNVVDDYISEPYGIKIASGINKEIFQKVMTLDFHYFDDPKFYDDYTWTLEQLNKQCTKMVSLVLCCSMCYN